LGSGLHHHRETGYDFAVELSVQFTKRSHEEQSPWNGPVALPGILYLLCL
jgi:hypothetical protein